MKVLFYRNEFGFSPFEVWLENISDTSIKVRIHARLKRAQAGNLGDYKYLEQGVFELRLFFGSGYRIYFGKDSDRLIILLIGGDKASQTKDIKKAVNLYKDYLRNKDEI